jgi:hypothetical protein
MSKKSISIASGAHSSKSSGLSYLSENAVLDKAKAKKKDKEQDSDQADENGSQEGKDGQFVSVIAGLTAKAKPILTTEEKVEAL